MIWNPYAQGALLRLQSMENLHGCQCPRKAFPVLVRDMP